MTGAGTIVSPNYLGFASTLASSYLQHHPGHRFFVLVVADLSREQRALFAGAAFEPVMLNEIGLHDLRDTAMRFDLLEMNTNVKPTFLKHLFEKFALDRIVYLDPDIFVYAPLSPVFAALDGGASMVLTPHITGPINDNKIPGEQDLLYNGTYNLGFIALRRCDTSARMLHWWEERCLLLGFSEGRSGLFVDQKWMNLAPGMFDDVAILRHRGCNMAYWNLHERMLTRQHFEYLVNQTEHLCFFHFSGIVVEDGASLSKHTDRFTLSDRPDLQELFAEYRRVLILNRGTTLEALPYGFDRLSDGTVITRLARRIYAQHTARWKGQDPFDANSGFARFAQRLRLVAGASPSGKVTWKEFNAADRRVRAIHRGLKFALRLLGPNRYELLMRYLAHVSILRNQSVFLDER